MREKGAEHFLIAFEGSGKSAGFECKAKAHGLLVKQQDGAYRLQGGQAAQTMAAALITELFFGPWEAALLNDLISLRYDCFAAEEQRSLLQKTVDLATTDDFCWGLFAGNGKEMRLAQALREHLAQHNYLHWEGFARFRLIGYREYLQTLLSLAADEVLAEQENADYLRLLHGFLAGRPAGGEIHVFLFRQGMYDICAAGPEGLLFLEGGRLAGCEDMLLFSLLHLAPRKICFHIEKPLPTVLHQLLAELFGAALHVEMLKAGPFVGQQLP